MNSFKIKLGIGIAVLIAAFIATQIVYRSNIAVLHDYLSNALILSEEMHDAEAFHSSMHGMLISARFSLNNKRNFDHETYTHYKKQTAEALERLTHSNTRMKNAVVYKSDFCFLATDELIAALTARFLALQKFLDPVALGKSSDPHRSFAAAETVFDDMFNNHYIKLHEHYDMQTSRMRESADQIKTRTNVYFAVQLVIAALAGIAVLFYLDSVVLKIHEVTDRYAFTDPLTSLYNRRYLDKYLSEELIRSARYQRPFSIVMVDVDNFKVFNDTYGHPAGDKLLKDIASIIKKCVRKMDIVARYGGEEFIMVFPELDKQSAAKVAEKIRALVASHAFSPTDLGSSTSMSISIGLAVFPEDGDTADAVIKKADLMLYKAKSEGKNRVNA